MLSVAMELEWDQDKAASNYAKHGISFEQAALAFAEPFALEYVDERWDYGEERIILIGQATGTVLLAVYTERGRRTRIITARRATHNERQCYHNQAAR